LLPENERLGGKDALILDGWKTFKMFGPTAFRVKLSQQFTVDKGAKCTLVVPIQVHGKKKDDGTYYNIDTGAAYWRVSVNGEHGAWLTYNNDFQDRQWFEYGIAFTAVYGTVDVVIEFESHTVAPIAFFIDDVQFSVQDNVPIEPECRGLPRVQYKRTYNLLPQNATLEQLQNVAESAYLSRETIGFSADDSGLGDLENKRVDIWWFSPDSWESEEAVNNFFTKYYPGTTKLHIHCHDPDPPPVDPPPIDPPPDFTPIN
ncbi:unnamed protein product, partial [marine sediment metagenome]